MEESEVKKRREDTVTPEQREKGVGKCVTGEMQTYSGIVEYFGCIIRVLYKDEYGSLS